MIIKKEIRVIGIDDGPFEHIKGNSALIVGVICRANEYVDGILSTQVSVDGLDATSKIIEMLNKTHHKNIRVALIDGLAVAGLNVININQISEETGMAVIAVTARKPRREKFISAIRKLDYAEKRLEAVKKIGLAKEIEIKGKKVYFQFAGCSEDDAILILKRTAKRCSVPEAIRLAHLIASGIVDGESRGRV